MCGIQGPIARSDEAWDLFVQGESLELKGPALRVVNHWEGGAPLEELPSQFAMGFSGGVQSRLLYEDPELENCPNGQLLAYMRLASSTFAGGQDSVNAEGFAWVITNREDDWVLDAGLRVEVGQSSTLDAWGDEIVGVDRTLTGYTLHVQGHPAEKWAFIGLSPEFDGVHDTSGRSTGAYGTWVWGD